MGLFDFLHWSSSQKSEAEIYMEKRNKEYTRRAAEYRRREMMWAAKEGLFGLGKTASPKRHSGNYSRPTNNYSTLPATQCQKSTTCQPHQQTYNKTISGDCDSCGTSASIYDSKHLDIFTVENAFTRESAGTAAASGVVVRGGFSVGDMVEVTTSLETRVVTIQQMFRQGKAIQYANTSSGKIAIILSNASDILLRKGDMIAKKK